MHRGCVASVRGELKKSAGALLIFLLIALIQAGYYIHKIGPLTIPDVSMHALGAYSLSTGQSFNPVETVKDEYGNNHKVMSLTGDSRFLLLEGGYSDLVSTIIGITYPVDANKESQIQGANKKQETIRISGEIESGAINSNRSNQYFPLAWLPQAVGVKVGLLLNLNPYFVWQLGRMTAFLVFLICWSYSIITIPKMKYLLVLIGVMPTTLFMASSLMCDAFLISLCALSVSITCRIICDDREVSNGCTAGLALLAGCVVLIKATYVPICLGFLILPRKVLNTRKKTLACVILLVSLAIYLFWSRCYGNVATMASLDLNQSIMLHNPINVLARLIYQIVNLPGYFGILNQMYLASALLLIICLLQYLQVNRLLPLSGNWREDFSSYRYVIGLVLAAFGSLMLILFFLLFTWNNLAGQSWLSPIEGFQGRYILPILPVLCYIQTVFVQKPVDVEA